MTAPVGTAAIVVGHSVVASQFPRVRDDIGEVAGVIPLYVAFLVVMAGVGWALARACRFEPSAARALVFTGATRNSLVVLPLALALGDEYAITGAVIVTQTLVEVIGMVAYVRTVPRLIPDAVTATVPGRQRTEPRTDPRSDPSMRPSRSPNYFDGDRK